MKRLLDILGRFFIAIFSTAFLGSIILFPPYFTGHWIFNRLGGMDITGFWAIFASWLVGVICLALSMLIIIPLCVLLYHAFEFLYHMTLWIFNGGNDV